MGKEAGEQNDELDDGLRPPRARWLASELAGVSLPYAPGSVCVCVCRITNPAGRAQQAGRRQHR
jgi:hypothetical protein